MRIVLLNDDAHPAARGGASVVVETLRRELAALGHVVTFITSHQDASLIPLMRMKDEAGERVSIYRSYPLSQRHRRCLFDPAMSQTLDALLAELRPDVVHAHNIHTYLTYDGLCVARHYTRRLFLTAHDTFLVSFGRVRGDAYEAAASAGVALRMHWWDHLRHAGRKYWPQRNLRIRSVLHTTGTAVIPISNAVADFLRANRILCTIMIPNGIELPAVPAAQDIEKLRSEYGLTEQTILFAGRVREDKGIGVLLRHFAAILREAPQAMLAVAGESEHLRPHLRAYPPAFQRAVVALGWVPPDRMPIVYAAARVVAVPSLYLDNFPTVNLEAMARGTPVVGTLFGGTKEAVIDGETGFICNPRDASFASAIMRLLKDPKLARRMGEAGRRRVARFFSVHLQAERLLQLYEGKPLSM